MYLALKISSIRTTTIQTETTTMKAMNKRTKKPADYLKEPYTRVLVPEEEGGYSAEILEFPGCYSCGDTADEAMANLEEAAISWIEAILEQGREVPVPARRKEYSGKIALRLPMSLHREAAGMALRENISLNQFLVSAIAGTVGALAYHNRLLQRLDGYLAHRTTVLETRASHRVDVNITLRSEPLPLAGIHWEPEAGATTVVTQRRMPRR